MYLGLRLVQSNRIIQNNRDGKNSINYTHTQITYVLQLFRDEGKQILKLSSTEFSQQLSDNYPHGKLSSPLPTTKAGLKTDADQAKEAGMYYVFTRSQVLHIYSPIVTLQGKDPPLPHPFFFKFEETEFQKVQIFAQGHIVRKRYILWAVEVQNLYLFHPTKLPLTYT